MTPASRLFRLREDRGAVAILTAILAIVLFGVAALAVELTDMFSRDRAVQTTADLAAFAGAQDLPDSCAAFGSALTSLNAPENGVRSSAAPSDFQATATQMSDNDLANGEIDILDARDLPTSACTQTGRKVRVVVPPRTVDFALAGALPDAPTEGSVRAAATVEIRSFDVSVLPLSLPSNCPSGSNYLYVDNSGLPNPSTTPDFDPNGNGNGPNITGLTPSSSPTLPGPASITVTLNDLTKNPSLAGNTVIFDFHLLLPDGLTTLRSPATVPDGVTGTYLAGTVTTTSSPTRYGGTFTVPVPADVQTTAGSWKIRGYQDSGAAKWTEDAAVGTLTLGAPSSTGCPDPSTGDFGLLASPRDGNDSTNTERIKNFIFGVDHLLFEVAAPDTDSPCASDGDPYIDGILDDDDPAVGPPPSASCVDVKPGASAALPANGLIDGVGSEDGRLVGAPGVSTSGDCRVANDPDMQWRKNGENLVNTALSCYLDGSATLDDVRLGTADSLVQDIVDDPRFFFIPVIDTSTRPPNSGSGDQYWPIKEFRGAFITNETNGGDATCLADEGNACNGLTFNGGAQIKAIQAFTFPLSALPAEVEQPGNGSGYVGGPKDFLLVE